MKKFIAGVVVGALISGAVPVFAESIKSLIGSKVSGVYEIEKKDGTKIADAAIINGSAYVPVRPISEATGTKITIEGKKIILGEEAKTQSVDIASLKEDLARFESFADKYNEVIRQTEDEIKASTDAKDIAGMKDYIEDIRGRLKNTEATIAEIKEKLGE